MTDDYSIVTENNPSYPGMVLIGLRVPQGLWPDDLHHQMWLRDKLRRLGKQYLKRLGAGSQEPADSIEGTD